MTNQPGPMGWGIPNEPEHRWGKYEQETRDDILRVAPQYMTRHAAKRPNAGLLAKVQEIQRANGIESGFCFLYLAQAIFGSQIDWLAQLIGSCVASGDMRTTAYRMMAEVFLLNDPEEVPGHDTKGRDSIAFFAPYNYRAGRRIAGINGNSDGSLCVPHIKGKMQFGHLPCSERTLNSDAFPEPQSTSTYKRWGANNDLMDQFASIAKQYPLIESEKIERADDFHTICCEHYKPANICSMWSFVEDYKHPTWKDENGEPVWIWKRGRSPWAHNMSVIGHVVVDGKEYTIIENSWRNFHRGRKWFAIPTELFDSWLRSAECQSVGEIDMSDNAPVWPEEVLS